ncbi:anti-sigma factor [Paludisphaera sp.]|uniref:anti-sigma factor n=1 Tax=Paludisphaera sp. TaxID=2017432 RepID=UPI00301B6D3F
MNDGLSPDDRDRLDGLLAEGAAFGLSPDEAAEIERLSAGRGDVDIEEFERLAAALYVGLGAGAGEKLPDHLRRICADQGRDLLASGPGPAPAPVRPPVVAPPRRWAGPPAWLGWVAAAACLLLAVATWSRPVDVSPAVELERLREEVLTAGDALTVPLKGVGPGEGSSGDLVWSNRRQRGFMRLRGVAANDPSQRQYQLWIFDRAQDERYPIDGGVFDINAPGEAVVPIHAPIRVREPYLFAVTVEKPGGVVVSDRDPIILLGDPAAPAT